MKGKIHAGLCVNGIYHYLCNGACGVTQGKLDLDWKYVTCKNCLQIMKTSRRVEDRGTVGFFKI